MAIYAVGDIQGCYDELCRLLDFIEFDPTSDRLWFTGDLVNRGPKSLEVIRFVAQLGPSAITVLGNHDLHLLAAADGQRKPTSKDTFNDVLCAPDREELLLWLRQRPLLHHDSELGYTLVHAGLPPQWDLAAAANAAGEVEAILQSSRLHAFLGEMYGDQPDRWDEHLTGMDRARFITNCFTRIRFCQADGRLDFKCKGPPGTQPKHLLPWFTVPDRASAALKLIFGHWSTLPSIIGEELIALDGGCVWGGQLNAVRLDAPPERIAIECPGAACPNLD